MNGRISNLRQIAKCRRVVCTDGKESGVRLIEIDNGVLSLELLESNALDIGSLSYKGRNISFISANGYDNVSTDFPHTFPGGMLYTCGLDSLGERQNYRTHGSLHGIPGSTVFAQADENGDIRVTGKMYFTALFGVKLFLTRSIELKRGTARLTIRDELQNIGFKDGRYCMLYHLNFGYPFLNENTYLQFDALSTVPRTPYAAEGLNEIKTIQPPVEEEERVYFHKLSAPRVTVVSPDTGLKAEINYSGDTLPCLVQWKSMVGGDYALGIEPATSFLDGGFGYKPISAGQKIINTVVLSFEEINL